MKTLEDQTLVLSLPWFWGPLLSPTRPFHFNPDICCIPDARETNPSPG